jgi:pyridoxamine 5'-phosphate oxidase
MKNNIADLREEYTLAKLTETDVLENPIFQFEKWFNEAMNAHIDDVNAMTLATVDENNIPHARIVLLKGIEQNQFVFFTNYQSQKAKDLLQNKHASLLFHWKELQRQVRIEGTVVKISAEASTAYFHSRPKESQLGAWASHQSQPLENREILEKRMIDLLLQYENLEVPKPPHWGGFALRPTKIEFWQGRSNRLHDRLLFTLENENVWQMIRLNP